MKNIAVQFKKDLPEDYSWFTVRELEWQGTRNGKLLERMSEDDFKGLITIDKSLYKQQNLSNLSLKYRFEAKLCTT
jgi:hypothetical protein